jgi:hypothetical protein
MNVEGGLSPYVEPLYGKPPKIIFDKKVQMTCCQFVKKYNFCNKGTNPKRLKIGKDYTKEVQVLKAYNSKNGYRYCFNKNEVLIKHVEKLKLINALKCQTQG